MDSTKKFNHISLCTGYGGIDLGLANWLDYARLCNSFSSIIDEIALLGNGVVPATAEIAFKTLFNKILSSLN